jgi:hypothetical protein
MSSILDMPVRLYTSNEAMAAGTPEWTGTLNEFWSENQDGYAWGEIRALADELNLSGSHRGGGGASAVFWLVRGEAGVPKGWDVAETSTEETPAEPVDELAKLHEDRLALVGALRDLAVWAEHMGGWEAPCWDAARQLLATHGARV